MADPATPQQKTTLRAPQQNATASMPANKTGPLPSAAPKQQPAAKHVRPDGGGSLGCWVSVLAMVAGFFLLVSVTNSKTGLLDIPWLATSYAPETLARRVAYVPMDWPGLQAVIATQLAEEKSLHGPPYRVTLTENQMTGLLADSLAGGLRDQRTEIRLAQMAVTPQGIEMAVRLTWRNLINIDLTGLLAPQVMDNGDLRFDVVQAKLGHVVLPKSWLWNLLAMLFTRDLGVWDVKIEDKTSLIGISPADKTLEMVLGSPTSTQP